MLVLFSGDVILFVVLLVCWLAAGVAYAYSVVLSPAVGAALMSLSTAIVAINAKLLERARRLAPGTATTP